jgi:hypothetical protein
MKTRSSHSGLINASNFAPHHSLASAVTIFRVTMHAAGQCTPWNLQQIDHVITFPRPLLNRYPQTRVAVPTIAARCASNDSVVVFCLPERRSLGAVSRSRSRKSWAEKHLYRAVFSVSRGLRAGPLHTAVSWLESVVLPYTHCGNYCSYQVVRRFTLGWHMETSTANAKFLVDIASLWDGILLYCNAPASPYRPHFRPTANFQCQFVRFVTRAAFSGPAHEPKNFWAEPENLAWVAYSSTAHWLMWHT